jgi:hypothetical protein
MPGDQSDMENQYDMEKGTGESGDVGATLGQESEQVSNSLFRQ